MDIKSISYKKIISIINELIVTLGNLDDKVVESQSDYKQKINQMENKYSSDNTKFNQDCQNEIASFERNIKDMLEKAKAIQSEIRKMDLELSRVDKYYEKTYQKRIKDLENKKKEELLKLNDGKTLDYFKILNHIQKKFAEVSEKYSKEMLPSVLNAINYVFSSKRKKDYEELILLQNTVDYFIEEMSQNADIITEETLNAMKDKHSSQRQEMINSQNAFKEEQENKYANLFGELSEEVERQLNRLLPDEMIKLMANEIEEYKKMFLKVNTSLQIKNNVMYMGYIDFPVKEYIRSNTLISYINQKCSLIMEEEKIRFPIILSTEEPFNIFIEKSQDGKVIMQQIVQGMMFSFLSFLPVMNLKFNVIDIQNHGNSVANYFDAKKKLPELFGDKFYTSQESAIEKIYELNEKVDYISQEILGTEYDNIFSYKNDNPNYDLKVEVITLFDFPIGLDEQALSALKNIIIYGQRCGIYLIISGESAVKADSYNSNEFMELIKQIKSNCFVINQFDNRFEFATLPFISYQMPSKIDFKNFFSKYILINDGIKNKGMALPQDIRKLMECKTDEELQESIDYIKDTISKYEERYGNCPDEDAQYIRKIPIGITRYPNDLFSDSFGYDKIKKEFQDETGKIALPLFMDCGASCNFLANYSEINREQMLKFTNNIIWSILSMFPVAKVDISIIDCERMGGNAGQFLDFKNKCPDVFDGEIFTKKESVIQCLEKINKKIDDCIQNKLVNKYSNILEYNKNNPNRSEICKLVVIYDFPSGLDNREIDYLVNILKNGGKCGVYVLIAYNKDIQCSAYDGIDKILNRIKPYSTMIDINDKNYLMAPFNLSVSIKDLIDDSKVNEFIEEYKEISKKIKEKGFSFEDILDKELFSRDTDKQFSIPIGIGDGEAIIPLTFGVGSSHHALVAGATGSGKSTLLHTLIMSAMLHYTPDLLNLYLMDFKGGTEFKIYDSYRLPHIKLLALDAMQEFGESILEDLVNEIDRRSAKFKSVNASKLSEYVKLLNQPMPKILVIMDEFQILFNTSSNRKVAYHCAELVKRIVTEGRSYGIHLLMATQSTKIIGDLSLDSGTIEQMRVRIGLKCGEYDTGYLFADKNRQKALDMMKGPIGTAVLNEEYTEQDCIGLRAAYCDDDTQEKYLNLISDKFSDYECNMQSFEGNKTVEVLEILPEERQEKLPLSIKIGTLIKVAPPLEIIFDKKKKHNTLICGGNDKMAENIVNLYTLLPLLNRKVNVIYIDGDIILDGGNVPENSIYNEFEKFGNQFKLAKTRGDIINLIKETYDFYLDCKNFQYLDILKNMIKGEKIKEEDYLEPEPVDTDENSNTDEVASVNPFDFGFGDLSSSSKDENVSDKLIKLFDDGSSYGINFVITSLEFQSVKECMQYGENALSKFPERYVFSLSDADGDYLIDGVSLKSLKDNTVYYTDSFKSTFQLKPYIFPKKKELEEFLAKVLKE